MKDSKGIAIVLVVFIVALASIIVINLTYSTFLSTRMTGNVARQLQAEYILKSLVNFTGVLLSKDTSADDSYQKDIWGIFHQNPRIPNEYLGIEDQSAEIYLEIIPQNSLINVADLINKPSNLASGISNDTRAALERLMKEPTLLDFDGTLSEEDRYGMCAGQNFNSNAIVGNLIDWQDFDNESAVTYPGIESSLNKEQIPNKPFTELLELTQVCGITENRFSVLTPFVYAFKSTSASTEININTALDFVLMAANPDLDSFVVEQIRQRISEAPFADKSDINNFMSSTAVGSTANYIPFTVSSDKYQVLGKVKYGLQRPYFVKAVVDKRGKFPKNVLQAVYF